MKSFLLSLLMLAIGLSAFAQNDTAADTLYSGLQEVTIKARWRNDTERYKYNQMKYYVTTILPYVNAGASLFKDINAKMESPNVSRHELKRYIGDREDEMRTKFEDRIKSLNVTQGALLVKLLTRQTNVNIYKCLQEFKNPLTAMKWQTWARLNGLNINRKYNPEEEPVLENIMYDLGYPLPASYAAK